MEVAELKAKWVGSSFDSSEFEVTEEKMLEFAASCGDTDPRFCDASNPDFQAAPTFTSQFHGHRMLPEGFPGFGPYDGAFDAGKCVEAHTPVRAGDRLSASSEIHDIYEKTGRSGRMTFLVHRMAFSNQRGELVSVVDWRLLQKTKT
jgi:acyl dehydratase